MCDYENDFDRLEAEASQESLTEEISVNDEEVLTVDAEIIEEPEEVTPQPVPEEPKPAPIPWYTSEYTYNPEPAPKKERKGGKIALSIIAGLLGVFIVVMLTLSIYTAILRGNGIELQTDVDNPYSDQLPDWSQGRPDYSPENLPQKENDSLPPADNETQDDNSAEPVATDREYPTLAQLNTVGEGLSIPDIYDKVSPSVVGVTSKTSRGTATGTGIIISADGYVITNAHVIDGAETVNVLLHDGSDYEAEIIGYDSQTDLAVIKIEASDLIPCEFGVSEDLRIGEAVVAIGNPLGFDLYGSITNGIISGKNRTLTIGDYEMNLLQTNASINSGNSGGPLIDGYGRVIGITSAKVSTLYGEGLGFAIPIDEAIPILNDLMAYGYVTGRPMIGISGEDITSIMSMYYRLPEGVYVRFITPDSCADKAGIKAGDIVIGADGETVTCMDELNDIKNRHSAGDTMTLTLYRDGKSMDVNLVLDEATQAE